MNNYTSIEQSRKLLELGLSPETADMWYQYTGISIKDGSKKSVYFPMIIRDDESDEDIPCWSVGALFFLMKAEINVSLVCERNEYFVIYRGSEFQGIDRYSHSSSIDAVYGMMCFLLENDYINHRYIIK